MRRRAGEAVERVPSRSVSCACELAAATAGMRPTTKPVRTDRASAKRTTGSPGENFAGPRQVRRRGRKNPTRRQHHDAEPGNPSGKRQHHTFGERLLDQPTPRRTESGSDREVSASPGCTGEEDVRDVDAGNEQHDSDTCEQQQQRRTQRTDGLFVERTDRHTPACVRIGIILCALRRNRRQVVASALDGCTFAEPSDDTEIVN